MLTKSFVCHRRMGSNLVPSLRARRLMEGPRRARAAGMRRKSSPVLQGWGVRPHPRSQFITMLLITHLSIYL